MSLRSVQSMISQRQLSDDLRGEFRGRLHIDAPTRTLYATDASPFQILPHAVAVPEDEADLIVLVKYAQEQNLPLVARGAGTGLSGESLGWGLIVDFSPHFRRIGSLAGERISVEVGVTLAELNEALAPHGRRFAPNPASSATCTLGGMLATNGSGGNAFVHGYTRDHVAGVRVIWDDGSIASLGSPQRASPLDSPRLVEIRSQMSGLLAANRAAIQVTRPQTRFNRCGYVLHDILTTEGVDLRKLLVGTEGTLGLMTSAELATIPRPGGTAIALLGFQTMSEAIRASLTLRAISGLVTCDLLDQRLISMARKVDGCHIVIPQGVNAVLVLESEAENDTAAEDILQLGIDRARRTHPAAVLLGPSATPEHHATVRGFRTAVVSGLYGLGSGPRPAPFIEDVAVPGEELVRFVAGTSEILRRHDLTGSFLVHVLAGQVHTRPIIDLNDPADRARLWPVAEAVHGLALNLGGTVSTQHGTGITRTPWVEKQYGPLLSVFREVKQIFDPKGILNPGKIIGPDPSRPAWPLRQEVPPLRDTATAKRPLLLWSSSPEREATKCHGCGECRTRSANQRMCPIFRNSGTELASPRAKANLLRVLEGNPEGLTADEVREIADQCVNCKMCRSECRSHVNIPKLALEAKAAHLAEHGLDRDRWLLARAEWLMSLAGNFSLTANLLLGHPASRWVFEKVFGLSRQRRMPRFTYRTFLRRAKYAGWTRRRPQSGDRRVAYFVDGFANTADPLIGEATVAVLRHQGIDVIVPPRQKGCGMAALAQGDVDAAADIAEFNVRVLAELARDQIPILCSEPTAAVALTQDYLDLLDSEDAKAVANQTVELTQFLWGLHEAGQLRTDFPVPLDLHLGHHVPCHIKALGHLPAGPRLLQLIPGVTVNTIDRSCSGMAGTYGLNKDTLEASLAAGEPMLRELRRPGIVYGSTECGACRMQMQEGSGKRTLHPVQYLAMAYGLVPELAARLHRPLGQLVSE